MSRDNDFHLMADDDPVFEIFEESDEEVVVREREEDTRREDT